MLSIDTTLWSLRGYGNGQVHVVQRSTGASRTVSRSALPSDHALAEMHELRFNRVCREAFHGGKA